MRLDWRRSLSDSRSRSTVKIRAPSSVLRRAARQGDRGYPIATVAFYGPDDRRASKTVLGIIAFDGAEPVLHKWHSETSDLRKDEAIFMEILNRAREAQVQSVAMTGRIIGCPHEEGIDYPDGEACPVCPFWKGRNRQTGELES